DHGFEEITAVMAPGDAGEVRAGISATFVAVLRAVAAHALAGGVGVEERGSCFRIPTFERWEPLGERVLAFGEGFIERGEGFANRGFLTTFCCGDEFQRGGGYAFGFF